MFAAKPETVPPCPMPQRPSTAYDRLKSSAPAKPPPACRLTNSTPTLERLARSCRMRPTVKFCRGVPAASTAAVCMFRNPTFVSLPTLPDNRPPPTIGICSPAAPRPIRRLKNTSTAPDCPTENRPAFSRKKGRFSGKNSVKRSRLICSSSTSTCAKSVRYVASRVRLGVMLYFRSAPQSPVPTVRVPAPRYAASPST